MESLVYFVMAHGTMVITSLLGAIIFCVFGLLMMSFHQPKEAVASEMGSVDRIEGVLRNILSDQNWSKMGGDRSPGIIESSDQVNMMQEQITGLENELKEKQRILDEIAGASPDDAGAAPFKFRIKELEEKLAEYSIIEEDIADLTRFRQENENLRAKITQVTGVPAPDALAMPWDEFERLVKEKKLNVPPPVAVNAGFESSADTNKPG